MGDLGTWPFMVKGLQHPIFLGCSSSGHVPVLWAREWGRGETLVPGGAGGPSSPFARPRLHDLQFGSLVSERQLGVSLSRTGTV